MTRGSAMLFDQRQVVGLPAGYSALEAERILVSGFPEQPGGSARRRTVGAHGEQDLALLLVDRVLALLQAIEPDVFRVHDVPRREFVRFAYVDHERALVDEAHCVGRRHVRCTLAAEPELV